MSMAADAKMIWAWAATLCTESDTIPADMVLSLGFWGTLDRQGDRYELQPAPEGTKSVWIGLVGEDFDSLAVELESIVPTTALEQYLGPGESLAGGSIGYRLIKPNAPNACVVSVEVDGGRVHRLTMRRVPASAPGHAPAKQTAGPMEISEFLRQAKDLAASGALAELKLRGAGGRVAELARTPELAKVVRLEMRNQGITDADIQALAASTHVSGLRLLSVEQNEIGQTGIEALAAAASTTLKALEAVGLDLNRVRDPADQFEFYDETHRERVATESGRALEAKHGRIAWLHPPE